MKILKFIPFFILLTVISCSQDKEKFVVAGNISDADSTMLYLEKRELSKTIVLDSVRLNKDGEFKFKAKSPEAPEFYVLKLNNQIINLAIDSTETIDITASKNNFATDYTVKGSKANSDIKTLSLAKYKANKNLADLQAQINNKEISDSIYIAGLNNISTEYRDLATKIIFEDLKSPAAYFALLQKVDDYLFFDPYNKNDYKIFGAVATSWDTYYPHSARAKQLRNFTLEALKIRKQEEAAPLDMDAATISSQDFFNIELPDVNNKIVSLASLRGKFVLVDFTLYQSTESPAHNMQLNSIYNKYKDKLEIYQVSLDPDKHLWQNAAANIPWVAVHDNQSLDSPLISKFNIQNLPAVYLFDNKGEVLKRIDDMTNLEQEIGKII